MCAGVYHDTAGVTCEIVLFYGGEKLRCLQLLSGVGFYPAFISDASIKMPHAIKRMR